MTPDEDRLRTLLDDAVREVAPRSGLPAIRRRTAHRSAARRRVWGSAGAVVATAATTAAVVVLVGPRGGDASRGRDGAAAAGAATSSAPAYFAGRTALGLRLFPETVVTAGAAPDPTTVVRRAVAGPPDDPDYRTLWPAGAQVRTVRDADGVIGVDLSGPVVDRPSGSTRAEGSLALQQVVATAQAVSGSSHPVRFLVDGRPTATLLGEPTTGTVAATAADATRSPVSVGAPAQGDRVRSPFTVTGQASAFEATVVWELLHGGAVVERGFATARECCTLSPYTVRIEAAPGTYTLVVHDQDDSDGEGVGTTRDTKTFQVVAAGRSSTP